MIFYIPEDEEPLTIPSTLHDVPNPGEKYVLYSKLMMDPNSTEDWRIDVRNHTRDDSFFTTITSESETKRIQLDSHFFDVQTAEFKSEQYQTRALVFVRPEAMSKFKRIINQITKRSKNCFFV
jgi:hypothetical protein